jgi:flagellar basal body-associated protein FliL
MNSKVLVLIVLSIVIITVSIVAYFMFNKKPASSNPSNDAYIL